MPITLIMTVLDRALVHLRIALNSSSKLRPTGKRYVVAGHFAQLDAEGKKRAGVCNMFVNIKASVDVIARHYKFSRRKVVRILLEEGYLEEQRKQPNTPVKGGRRETANGRRGRLCSAFGPVCPLRPSSCLVSDRVRRG